MAVKTGSVRALRINGRHYSATNDSRPDVQQASYNKSSEVNADGTLHTTAERKPYKIESLDLSVTHDEYLTLLALNDSLEMFPVVLQLADGSTHSAMMHFNEFPSFADGKVSLTLHGEQGVVS